MQNFSGSDDDDIEDDFTENFPNNDDDEEVYLGATFTTLQAMHLANTHPQKTHPRYTSFSYAANACAIAPTKLSNCMYVPLRTKVTV